MPRPSQSVIKNPLMGHQIICSCSLHAYHVFVQAAVVCQGLLQYLAVAFPKCAWDAFGSWLRTVRPGIPPSELAVANALRQPPRPSCH